MNDNASKEKVTIEEAVSLLLAQAEPVSVEEVGVQSADRRILAENINAKVSLPPFARSAYDGFAMRAVDTQGASAEHPVRLSVLGTVAAGECWESSMVPEGSAVRIMTGAALPVGTDCVINFERVSESDGRIVLSCPLSPLQNVDRKGDEVREGAPLFSSGERLTPAHIGVLASQGIGAVHVYRKPKAAVFSTGSELAAIGQALPAGKIYDSNLYTLCASLEREGYDITESAHLPDDETVIRNELCRLAKSCDLILTTGGASVGDRDFAQKALISAGAELLFSRVRMKPGSCCFGARLGGALIVSLSGNPGAALTAYLRIALPAIRKIAGWQYFTLEEKLLPLQGGCRKKCPNPRILKGHTETVDGKTFFVCHEGQRNGMRMSFLHMNALAEVPPLDAPLAGGTPVRVFLPGDTI